MSKKESKEEKVAKKKSRAFNRAKKHNEKYHSRISQAQDIGMYVPLYVVRRDGTTDSWADSSSPTGYSQVCSYQGICQSPCNGDC